MSGRKYGRLLTIHVIPNALYFKNGSETVQF